MHPMIPRTHHRRLRAGLFGAAILAAGLPAMPASAADIVLNETGSTLLYPLFQRWVPAYAAARPNVKINTAATGSGAGIEAAIAGTAQIGASDAYMSDEEAEHNRQIISVPLAISAQTIDYNIPGLAGPALKLDGTILAGIYSGQIQQWDDPAIVALNPNTKLPHQAIVPIRRDDASGDTFVFTQFLDFANQKWEDGIGYGTTVKWPDVSGEVGAKGNDGMVKTLAATPYSIGYVGISFSDDAGKAKLGTVLLKNQGGKFVLPTPATVSAAAATLDPRTPPDERLTLVFAPGANSYPLINYEYAIVSAKQPDPQVAAAISNFLLWCISPQGGSAASFLDPVHFIALPRSIRARSEMQIAKIQ